MCLPRNELQIFLLPNFSYEDVVTARLEGNSVELWLVLVYAPHDDDVEPPPDLLKRALAGTKRRRAGVIIGTDANSKHTVWGSSNTNAIGESLFDFVCSKNLYICNRVNFPTFVTASRTEVFDVTLASREMTNLILEWGVLDDPSFYDPRS